ncbi:uncharacterized protein IL334_006207 [Kwoniella shivajii]|uniref:HIT-type domain-containing protein n=1 Tax=Kwoniella shivajii TaxID=564305 RepID=A0ABZ1D5Y6_9TREE|nr:hypothetical protein IL334_006207 [Kwoniella shivajii]
MSIKQPKPLQIRLPFSVPKPNKSTNTDTRICGICRKNQSRYTCPRCNIVYCSLDCFRDESHAQCSEPFYKSTVLSSIASDPKAGLDEKKNMIEMLRRFEQAQAEGGGDTLAELEELERHEEDEDELLEKLKDIDLDEIDSNQLFHLLPQHHRDAFLTALKNPDSQEAKELLDEATKPTNTLKTPSVLPWWEDHLNEDSDGEEEQDSHAEVEKLETASMPELLPNQVINTISPPEGVGKKLIYNAVAICIAYLHTLLSFRLPALSYAYLQESDISPQEMKEYLGQLVPFLVQPKSTTRYENLSSAWGDVWDKIGDEMSSPPTISILLQLLSLLPSLIHPPIITTSSPKIFNLLSDLYHLFSTPKAGGAIPRKIAFYFKSLQSLTRQDWLLLEREVERELNRLKDEDENVDAEQPERRERLEML